MKKFIAILLVSLMALSMIPMMVSAEEAQVVTIEPYGVGWENWSDQTQLLICVNLNGKGNEAFENADMEWEITIDDGTAAKTIKAKPSSIYSNYLLRFEVCTFEGANQYIPAAGATCTVSVKGYEGDTLKFYTESATAGWNVPADFAPILPPDGDQPVVTETVTVTPSFGKIENYGQKVNTETGVEERPAQTFFIINLGIGTAKETYAQLKNGELFLKLVITDAAGKTYTISKYAYDSHAQEYYSAGGFMRALPAAYGIPVEKDGAYTVAMEIYNANGDVLYKGTSETGAFVSSQENFLTNGPIAWKDAEGNTEVTHYYDEHPSNNTPDPKPPVAGDATAIVAVLAVVALFGTAVIVKKVND